MKDVAKVVLVGKETLVSIPVSKDALADTAVALSLRAPAVMSI